MLTDLAILFLLLLMNGFFAMAELAIVSARKARLRQMAEEPKGAGARRALSLAEDTTSFLSVVQIGVTLNSVLAGAFSGATLAEPLGEKLNEISFVAPFGEPLAIALTVVGVTYLSLVIGELAPKRVGLAYAEIIAVRVAFLMQILARIVAPIVWILRLSTDLLLRLFGLHDPAPAIVTEEEVKEMIAEGARGGVFKLAEKDMIEGVMRLADRNVRSIMTPRVDMVWLGIEDTPEENARIILESGYSRFPVAKGDMEEILGVVHAKDMLNVALQGGRRSLRSLMRAALVVPDTTSALRLLDQFRQSRQHVAVVIDEYGSVEGLVSVTDILEAIIGDLPEPGQESDFRPVRRADGSWLIDGMTPIDEVETLLGIRNMKNGGDFHTLAGFVIDKLGRIPRAGDHFTWEAVRFEVLDMDSRRVDKVLVVPPSDEDQEID